MTRPERYLTRVAVVRPTRTTSQRWGVAIAAIGWPWFNAWVLMLIIGRITAWHPGYWTTLLVLVGVNLLRWTPPRPAPDWTWPERREGGAR